MILLDTDVCIGFLGKKDAPMKRFVIEHEAELRLCSVVKAELLFGARASAQVDQNLEKLHRFFNAIASLDFDDAAAEQYGLIRAQLKRAGTPIGPNDLMIAAIALANDASLATRNVGEFSRVPALRLVDTRS